MASRHGPLTATPDGLAIGDVAALHVRLRADGVAECVGDAPRAVLPWSDIRALRFSPPTTIWPWPGMQETVGSLLLAVLGDVSPLGEVERYPVVLTVTSGDEVTWEVDPHYIAGYRRSHVRSAQRIVEVLTSSAESRALLRHPADALTRLAAVGRRAAW
ncbi:hypothetical protein [Microbacterium sp. JZ37]|uniref:hypothetical protein n=1 Tax=Microbacterium sp. JZ37 TaxID=2654193 RepID=UPI002B46167F|nr:hypothetical protein [Microbacterium sp. JZ37]WRH18471.1 hypothetical protein GC092_13715 [Microbacterium sp. JZ37]